MLRLLRTTLFVVGFLFMTASPGMAQSPAEASDVDLFLLAGQSNMAGRGDVQPEDTTAHPRVWALNAEDRWVPAVDPIHFDKPVAGVGPGRMFGISIAEKDTSVVVGLIPAAVGGSPIEVWQPNAVHEQTGIHPYDAALARVKAAVQEGELKAILWHQGEGDTTTERAPLYEGRLKELIQRFRTALNAPDLPFIIGQLGQFDVDSWSRARSEVNEAHIEVAAEVPNVAFVSSVGLTAKADDVHFDAASARELGRRYAEAYWRLIDAGDE